MQAENQPSPQGPLTLGDTLVNQLQAVLAGAGPADPYRLLGLKEARITALAEALNVAVQALRTVQHEYQQASLEVEELKGELQRRPPPAKPTATGSTGA